MAIIDVQVVVAGLGPGGATALASLKRGGTAAVGIEQRARASERFNLVSVAPTTREIIRDLKHGPAQKVNRSQQRSVVPIGSVERSIRSIAASLGAQARYNTAITGVELLADDRVLVSMAGTSDVYRATYLLDGTGGRLPLPPELAIEMEPRPGRDSFVVSLWQHEPGPRRATQVLDDPAGVPRATAMHRARGTGVQLTTRLGADAPPLDILAFDEHMRQQSGIATDRLRAPFVVDVNPMTARSTRNGPLLLLGDSIRRVHPATGAGLNLAVQDGRHAAVAVTSALNYPTGADGMLNSFEWYVEERHRAATQMDAASMLDKMTAAARTASN